MRKGHVVVLLGVLGFAGTLIGALSTSDPKSLDDRPSDQPLSLRVDYPEDWRTSLDTALTQAKFRVIIPDHGLANRNNVAAAYLWPDGVAVALQFPRPSAAPTRVRQPYIEVWQSPWTGGDPLKD
jgi:hypothetical protein